MLAALVAVVAVAVFAPALGGRWIFDDHDLIQLNPFIHSFHWWWHWFSTDLWNDSVTSAQKLRPYYYRPLVTLSYAIDWALGNGSPLVFHVTNLVWEAAAGALAFFALRRWLGAWLPALLAALLFVVHPTKAQSVAWIAGRIDVMCAVGLLLASTGVAWRLSGRRGGLALEVAGTLLAYLTKEMAIAMPAFVVVETWVALERPAIDFHFAVQALRKALPQLGLAIAYLAVRQVVLPLRGTVPATAIIDNRVDLVLATFGHAAELVFFPSRLLMQHGLVRTNPSTGHAMYGLGFVVLGAIAIAALAAGAWWTRRRAPGVALGLLFFVVTFLPTSNVLPTRLAELLPQRFLYVPLLGLALVVGELVRRTRRRHLGVAVCSLVTVAFAARSVVRAVDYSNEKRLWHREVADNPFSSVARLQLAYIDLSDHRYDAALQRFVQAYALAHRWFAPSGREVNLIFETLDLLVYETPDAQKQELDRIDRFVVGALEQKERKIDVSLDHPRLHAGLTLDSDIVKQKLAELRPNLLITHALIQSRVGSLSTAARAALDAYGACSSCTVLDDQAALVLARSGRYADAQRILDHVAMVQGVHTDDSTRKRIQHALLWNRRSKLPGPPGLLARARELSILGAYGRAFAVLEPHEDAIRNAPQMLVGYAQLAWRAGHHDVARRVLSGRVPDSQIEQLTRRWSQRAGPLQKRHPNAH